MGGTGQGGVSSDAEDLATLVTHGPAWGAVSLVCAALGAKFMALLSTPFLGRFPGTTMLKTFGEDPSPSLDLAQLS